MKRLLITGAGGMLGWSLCRMAGAEWQTYGAVFNFRDLPAGIIPYDIDLTQAAELATLFDRIRPDAVIHAAALSSPEYCETHPEASHALNVGVSEHIARLCAEYDIPCLFTSTDWVFDGEHPPYDEQSEAKPLTVYGQHKLLAENRMRSIHSRTTVCRLPLMFGMGGPSKPNTFKGMMQAIRQGESLHLYTDEVRTPVSTRVAAGGIFSSLKEYPGRTVHLGGAEPVSRWVLGTMMCDLLGADPACLVPCRQRDMTMAASRPRDVSLVSRLSAGIGYQPADLRSQLSLAWEKR